MTEQRRPTVDETNDDRPWGMYEPLGWKQRFWGLMILFGLLLLFGFMVWGIYEALVFLWP